MPAKQIISAWDNLRHTNRRRRLAMRKRLEPFRIIQAQGPKRKVSFAIRLPREIILGARADRRTAPVRQHLDQWLGFAANAMEHYALSQINGVAFKGILFRHVDRIAPELEKVGITAKEAKGFLDGWANQTIRIMDDFKAGRLPKELAEKELGGMLTAVITGFGDLIGPPQGRRPRQ